ncbi:hypothetical protein Ae717Ps2_6350c [Pseudonocardia sp. Ae717_Ps2]|nr:hypothetical protein Ae717Ps2_6350c [Pseudonocardia sp. Ae717_Ps2]
MAESAGAQDQVSQDLCIIDCLVSVARESGHRTSRPGVGRGPSTEALAGIKDMFMSGGEKRLLDPAGR